ncbi:tautomerase [Arcobacter sp. CECT 8985]|uniref:tautomerase n=1 Tax=Arcobacter sp. CECT 8985 TaxID=1935424 RepID=UPI00100B7981|nr:tautomerase [Arcobacter sp. CECT 8985]RXJ85219.1 tautomerase [Arcobacter sp. CECT 8985]
MPHLQFDVNKKIIDGIKREFIKQIQQSYEEVTHNKNENIAISIKEMERYDISLSKAVEGADICLMQLDIIEGKTKEQKKELALRFMAITNKLFEIDNRNQFITFTQHDEQEFQLIKNYISSWEEPIA